MERASHALHTTLDHIYRSWSHQQYGGVRVSKISRVEAIEREDKRTTSWKTLIFNQAEHRGPRRNREGGILVENGFMVVNQEKNCHSKLSDIKISSINIPTEQKTLILAAKRVLGDKGLQYVLR